MILDSLKYNFLGVTMLCRIRIENRLMSHTENVMIGREIGRLCRLYAHKKLTATDYVGIAALRSRLVEDKVSVLDECNDESIADAVKLMPTYMAAYLLYLADIA